MKKLRKKEKIWWKSDIKKIECNKQITRSTGQQIRLWLIINNIFHNIFCIFQKLDFNLFKKLKFT